MLKVARLPHRVVHAFAKPDESQVKPVYPLAMFCSDEGNLPLVFKRVHILCDVQTARQKISKPPLGAADVIRQLLNGPDQTAPSPIRNAFDSQHGRTMLSLASRNRQGLTLRLHAGSGATSDELA